MDYTDFKPTKDGKASKKVNKPEEDLSTVNKRWWTLPDNEMARSIDGVVVSLKENQSVRLTQYMASTRLYGNLPGTTWGGITGNKVVTAYSSSKKRITYNVCQSAVDTLTSKIGKNKPKPYFLTNGGNYRLKRKAQKLGKFVDGVFYYNNLPFLNRKAFKDSGILGTGIVHIFPKYGQVCAELCKANEFFIDDNEVVYGGKPRQLHWLRGVDRLSLAEMFKDEPKKVKMIMEAAEVTMQDEKQKQANVGDQIAVIESWHLPSGPDAKDGMHVMVIDAKEPLLKEEYKRPKFPFAFFNYNDRQWGFWGQGAIEQIQNIQTEINTILILIQRSMHLMGSFKIAIENTSKIVKQHLNNELGTLVNYTKTPPQYMTPPIVQPEIYQHLQTLKNSAFEVLGVSQLSAQSKKPDDLVSGKALREYNDIESDRFMALGLNWEQFHLDETELIVWCAKDIYENDKGLKVHVPGKKFIDTIKWSEVDMAEDQYILKTFPVSSLPDDPSGRLQTIQEYMQAGLMSPRAGRRALDFPDLEQIEGLANAQEDWVNEILEKIVMEGKATVPVPELDLDLASEMVLQYIAENALTDLEPAKMQMLRTFGAQVKMLKDKAMAAAQPAQPIQQPGQAPANPSPAPVSQLVPNVNQGAA
jgi:hypothetical protein